MATIRPTNHNPSLSPLFITYRSYRSKHGRTLRKMQLQEVPPQPPRHRSSFPTAAMFLTNRRLMTSSNLTKTRCESSLSPKRRRRSVRARCLQSTVNHDAALEPISSRIWSSLSSSHQAAVLISCPYLIRRSNRNEWEQDPGSSLLTLAL